MLPLAHLAWPLDRALASVVVLFLQIGMMLSAEGYYLYYGLSFGI